jgi:hypothetical protein
VTNLIRLFGICLLGLGCGEESETDYSQFNATTDTMTVSIGPEVTSESLEIELHSSTGQVIVGTAVLTPGGGPVGTEHELVVEIANAWQSQVKEVTIHLDSGERGEEEFTLKRDSADPGYHLINIVSVGEEGESREDTITIQLFADDSVATESNDTGANQ